MAKTVTLPSGKVAEIGDFKGKHIREAQRIAEGKAADQMTFAMIAVSTTIDGQMVTMEELDEMDGFDVLALMGEFTSQNPTLVPGK